MNWFDDDVALAALLADILPSEVLAEALPALKEMGAAAADKLDGWAFEANANPPTLKSWDREGKRVDEIDLQVNPVILGAGERLFDGFAAGTPGLELERVLEAPGVAHLRYRVVR